MESARGGRGGGGQNTGFPEFQVLKSFPRTTSKTQVSYGSDALN